MSALLDQVRSASDALELAIKGVLDKVECHPEGDGDNSGRSYELTLGERTYKLNEKTVRYSGCKFETTVTCDVVRGETTIRLFFDDSNVRVTVNGKEILVTLSLQEIEPALGRAVLEKLQTFTAELGSYTAPAKVAPTRPEKKEGPCTPEDIQSLRDF